MVTRSGRTTLVDSVLKALYLFCDLSDNVWFCAYDVTLLTLIVFCFQHLLVFLHISSPARWISHSFTSVPKKLFSRVWDFLVRDVRYACMVRGVLVAGLQGLTPVQFQSLCGRRETIQFFCAYGFVRGRSRERARERVF